MRTDLHKKREEVGLLERRKTDNATVRVATMLFLDRELMNPNRKAAPHPGSRASHPTFVVTAVRGSSAVRRVLWADFSKNSLL